MAKRTRAATTKHDRDLFERLRHAGVRKQVARSLSELGEGTGRTAVAAARAAVAELRSLAEEIERRLPTESPNPAGTASRARRGSPRADASARKTSATAGSAAASSSRKGVVRAPRGQNKASIMEALRSGPKTASEVAGLTGIGAGTVSSTLTKMAQSGEIAKAARGYQLPS